MNESRMPAGYVPLTVHQIGSNGSGRSQGGRSDGGSGHSAGSSRSNGKSSSKGSKGPRNAKSSRGDRGQSSDKSRQRKPRAKKPTPAE